MKKNFVRTVFVGVAFLTTMAQLANATTLIHRNLKGLVTHSERIFVGKCVSVAEGELVFPNGKIFYTEYTFEVSESIKGNVGERVMFRQYGLTTPRQISENLALYNRVPSMPVYHQNEEYMLFLIRDSRFGLTSPVGLHQGAFTIRRDAYGQAVAVNGIHNRGLFMDLHVQDLKGAELTQSEQRIFAGTKGPLVLKDLVSVVKRYAQSYK